MVLAEYQFRNCKVLDFTVFLIQTNWSTDDACRSFVEGPCSSGRGSPAGRSIEACTESFIPC